MFRSRRETSLELNRAVLRLLKVSEDNSPLVAALAASGAALCCICGAAGACRSSSAKPFISCGGD